MSGASIRLDHDGAGFASAFGRLLDATGDLTPAMRAIAGQLHQHVLERFDRQAGPGRRAWARLAASTIRRKPRRAPPAFVLQDTRRLYVSLVSDADATTAAVGTNVPYAALHQFGGRIQRAAREGSALFRMAREGAGRTKDGRRVGSKLRFARATSRAKSLRSKSFTVGAHAIEVPARPFLGFDAEDERAILHILEDHLARAAGIAP